MIKRWVKWGGRQREQTGSNMLPAIIAAAFTPSGGDHGVGLGIWDGDLGGRDGCAPGIRCSVVKRIRHERPAIIFGRDATHPEQDRQEGDEEGRHVGRDRIGGPKRGHEE